MLSKLQRSQLNRTRIVGGEPSIRLTDGELLALLGIVCKDLQIDLPTAIDWSFALSHIKDPFYQIPISTFHTIHFFKGDVTPTVLEGLIFEVTQQQSDAFTYFIALAHLHAQRRKYLAILEEQSFPAPETIIPRGLLEIGEVPMEALASWLVLRKLIYDIDNRSAQTTGYLFEPILTLALGGVSYAAKHSPVRRDGQGRGRQIDCLVDKDAYEFKMRVTTAASGQGRFAEELSYAEDCHASGFRPILLVLDPTPSSKQGELVARYRKFNGEAYVGDAAWMHLASKSGKVMTAFIENYIKAPMTTLRQVSDQVFTLQIKSTLNEGITVQIDEHIWRLR